MANFSLLKDLDKKTSIQESTKTKFQIYEIKSGIELIKACVPVDRTAEFETMYESLSDVNSYSVKKLLDKINGYIKD
jgi:fructose-1,6-bisphosphatase